ncbi:MAG: MFS transporter [Sphingopyxis sp.]
MNADGTDPTPGQSPAPASSADTSDGGAASGVGGAGSADGAPHPLRYGGFRAYLIGRFSMTLALNALMLIIGWQVYNLARETLSIKQGAFVLGLVGLVQFVPLFLLTPITGWVADRFDRRLVARITLSALLALALALALLTRSGHISLPLLFVFAATIGVLRAFSGPAMSALSPNLVPRASLPTAIALSSIAWQSGSIVGPGLGGLLLGVHPAAAYFACAALLAVAVMAFLVIGPVPQPAMARDVHPIRQMVDGLRYVRENRMVLATITLDLFAVLVAGAPALLPVFARDILHVGPQGLGMLAAAPATGAAAMALLFSIRPLKRNVGLWMLGAVVVFGASTILFGLSRWFPLSIGALVVVGASDMISVYVRQSLIQLHTPDAMRGRVSSVSKLTVSASNELGEAESGFLAALIGPMPAVVLGGVGAIAITLMWARLFPELALAKSFDPPNMHKDTHAHPAQERQL